MKQIPGREEVIRAIDKAMSEESGYIPRVVEDFNRINESQLRTISFLAHSVEELDQQCRQQAKMLKHYESILCETLSSGSNMEGMAHWIQKEVDEKRD